MEKFKHTCIHNYTCFYSPAESCSFFHKAVSLSLLDVYASNGGLCSYAALSTILLQDSDVAQIIITKSFPPRYRYKSIKPRDLSVWNAPGIYMFDENFQKVKPENYTLIKKGFKYVEEEVLFMEINFENFNDIKLSDEREQELFQDAEEPEETPVAPVKYSNFTAGFKYLFHGKILCDNGKAVGDDAKVKLIEVDDYSPDDIVDSTNVENDFFKVIVASTYNDLPSRSLELKLQFEKCCGYSEKRISGILVNGTAGKYTLFDNNIYAKFDRRVEIVYSQ